MARPCKICTADLLVRSRIEALRGAGSSYRQIAELVPGFNMFAIQRHFRHIGQAATKAVTEHEWLSPLEKSEKRLNELAERAEQSWLAAAATGDSRAALDVLKSQIRLELERHSRIQEKQETAAETAVTDSAPTPEQFAAIKSKVDGVFSEMLKRGFVSCPVCGGPRPIDPQIIPARIKNWQESHADSNLN
jgi:hypothetical protein